MHTCEHCDAESLRRHQEGRSRMPRTMNAVQEYKAARSAIQATPAGTQIHQAAQAVVDDLGPKEVTYEVPCMICSDKIEHTMTVAAAADLLDQPRGICGRCA